MRRTARRNYRRKPRKTYRRRFSRRGRRVGKVTFLKRTFKTSFTILDSGFRAIDINSALGAAYKQSYTLDKVSGYANFDLYDQIKLCAVKNKYVFNRNSADVNQVGDEIPVLMTVNDWNDGNEPGSEAVMLEYPSFKMTRLDRITQRYFKPRYNIADANFKSLWLDEANASNEYHYGLKMAVNTTGTTGLITLGVLDVYTTYYIALKNPK